MDLLLRGRHALVCGASRGIGRAVAGELAGLGADVTLLARSAGELEKVRDRLPARGDQRHGLIATDICDHEKLVAAVKAVTAVTPISILVNNTGGPPGGPLLGADSAAFAQAFDAHLLAAHALVKTLAPGMRGVGYGRIINIVSTSVREPIAGLGVSNTVRAAMAGWAKTLANELGPDGITVNNVLPGFTTTDRLESIIESKVAGGGGERSAVEADMLAQVPLRRFAEPWEVAAAVAFLASPAAAYISGVSLAVDGGRTRSI